MGKKLVQEFGVARVTFEEASDALGINVEKLCFEGDETELALTANTQPAVLLVSIAALRVLKEEFDFQPAHAAGHSLGEYTSLVAAGAMCFTDALLAVRKRGIFMQEAVPEGEGAMAAVLGLEEELLERICTESAEGEVLKPANFNAPGQVVISGHASALERALGLIKENRGKARKLKVSAPFHSELMKPAAERMAEVLAQISYSELAFPVISNAEAGPYPSREAIPEILTRQITSPVRWSESVNYMVGQGSELFLEIGPGKVLAGLIKRIAPGVRTLNFSEPRDLREIGKEL
jgi:[acyl-carrier-protein] S-malonyltransferase